nr:HAD hydrolase-like protein [uncultured Capnocytophaga sp.]
MFMKQYTAFYATKVSEKTIFLIDLDGTLVDTDYANYLAYHYAIKKIFEIELSYDRKKRFTRNDLKKIFPNIQVSDFEKIVRLKEDKYKDYLSKTVVNKDLMILLQNYHKTNAVILVTKCHRERAKQTLSYHNLELYFTDKVFSEGGNKYKEAINSLQLATSSVVVFEDDDTEIENAIKVGILEQNINKVIF